VILDNDDDDNAKSNDNSNFDDDNIKMLVSVYLLVGYPLETLLKSLYDLRYEYDDSEHDDDNADGEHDDDNHDDDDDGENDDACDYNEIDDGNEMLIFKMITFILV